MKYIYVNSFSFNVCHHAFNEYKIYRFIMNVLIEHLWYNNLKLVNIYDHLIKMIFDDKLT